MKFFIRHLYIVLFVGMLVQIHAQSSQLAIQYYKSGEYEKAAAMLQPLSEKNQNTNYFLELYVDCLVKLQEQPKAIQALENRLRKKEDPALYVALAEVYKSEDNEMLARTNYRKAIERLSPNRAQIIKLAQDFTNQNQTDLAIAAYKKGAEILNDPTQFSYQLAILYQKEGDIPNMIEQFILSLDQAPARLNNVKIYFQRYLDGEEDFKVLQQKIFERIRSGNNADHLSELLAWAYIQNKDYASALRQARSLDLRNQENGRRIYQLAQTAENDGDYNLAIQAYEYILNSKGAGSPYFIAAQQQILDCKLQAVLSKGQYTREEIQKIFDDYTLFLDENGRGGPTASIMADQAEIAALYLDDTDAAIEILQQIVDLPGINPLIQSRAKLELGDYYLIGGQRWDATLLYAQVDKAFPEAEIGETARFRNALLSYYVGEFEWAQEQFDILKAATSRLIANDAIDRSVFIMDNLNLDTTPRPLSLYAKAELLVFQNNFVEAFLKLDTLSREYPEHGLLDDIYYLRGMIALKQNKFAEARDFFQKIVTDFPEEIRADNALYQWAQLEEKEFENTSKAMELYEKLFLEHAYSTLAMESRKKFRQLRGDDIQ